MSCRFSWFDFPTRIVSVINERRVRSREEWQNLWESLVTLDGLRWEFSGSDFENSH